MASSVWQRLTGLVKNPEYQWAVWVFGILAGVLIPLLLVMGGWLIQLLVVGQHAVAVGNDSALPDHVTLGQFIDLPTTWLNASGSTLRALLGIIVLVIIVLALECIALLTSYRASLHTSLDMSVDIQRQLFHKSGALAIEQGLSGQHEAMRDMLFMHVPQVREAVSQWYRVFPRHIIQSSLLILLAASIHLWLTSLAIVCALILWALHSNLEIARRKKRPVQFERARAATEQLAYLCETAPLLASLHDQEDTKSSFESHLLAYRQSQWQLSDGGIWKSPSMLIPCSILFAFVLIVMAIRYLDSTNPLHFGELATMSASVIWAILGIQRLHRAYRRRKSAEGAVESLVSFLEKPTIDRTDRKWVHPTGIRHEIVLDHVTLRDSSSQKLLEDISVAIKPGELTVVIASQLVQASALAELILGFGRPASGRILMDGIDWTDIDPEVVRNFSLWVAAKGPLVNGTLEENLWAGFPPDAELDLMAMAKRMHVADPILNLPDGLATIVTPNEDRLQPDQLFRLGLTRGLIKRPSLIVAQEPAVRVKPTTEAETLDALQQLKTADTMLVVLSQRLSTWRAADQIIVLHEHRVAAVGTHASLLEQSEIYRHLNYLQFSPFGDSMNTNN